MLKNEIKIFFTALMFYTRIPCPKWADHSPAYLTKATRYFPLVGWLTGGLTFAVYDASSLLLPIEISVILSMAAGILVTGALHEDGFADVCDGFGGGWTKQKILEIMKDSRVGAFGVIGLVFLLLLKFFLLLKIVQLPSLSHLSSPVPMLLLFITAHAVSRLASVSITFTHQYAREEGGAGKSGHVARQHTWKEVLGAFIFGLFPVLVLSFYGYQVLYAIIPLLATRFLLSRYFKKWIGGYTGDCLGAAQQICEVVFYLSIIVIPYHS